MGWSARAFGRVITQHGHEHDVPRQRRLLDPRVCPLAERVSNHPTCLGAKLGRGSMNPDSGRPKLGQSDEN